MHPRSDYKQLYRCNVTAHTSFFQEVEWPQEATGSGDFRLTVSRQLGKLVTRQVYESGDVAEDQIREDLWVLMSQSFHKEVRVEDHWLACIWFLHAGKHTALRLPAENTSGIKVFLRGVHRVWSLKWNYSERKRELGLMLAKQTAVVLAALTAVSTFRYALKNMLCQM